MTSEHFDVLIVGAGLSGIGAALPPDRPAARHQLRDPRVPRGDRRDVGSLPLSGHSLGLGHAHARVRVPPVDGREVDRRRPSISSTVRDTARDHGVDEHIRFHHRVVAATLVDRGRALDRRGRTHRHRRADRPHRRVPLPVQRLLPLRRGLHPEFPGRDAFGGEIVHPQHWPEDLDYQGKRVVVIGSGATAMTLVPALANGGAAHITMLQRSPTYVVSLPARTLWQTPCGVLPAQTAYDIVRWKNVTMQTIQYQLSRRAPGLMKRLLRFGVKQRLPEGYDLRHFTPTYNRGTSACASCPTPTCSRRSAGSRRRS